jgi:hypothetical protein
MNNAGCVINGNFSYSDTIQKQYICFQVPSLPFSSNGAETFVNFPF